MADRTTSSRTPTVDVVGFLSCSDSYPDRPSSVSVIETHISWLFLTDHDVYKLKKPVQFEFLDYRDPLARRTACEAELRLNRRLTDGVYLAVLPLTMTASGQLLLGGDGTPVDWVVHMRRLPENRFLDGLIRAQQVTDGDIECLVQRLVSFYRSAERVAMSPGDYLAGIVHHVQANQSELRKHEAYLDSTQIRRVHGAQLRFLSLRPELFAARVRDERIIEGHGDLRPEHVCLTMPVQIFDCVEFSQELRSLDVADELAFLDVECELLGANDIGRRVFAAYSLASGDMPPTAVVAFYKSYRASVRAKVAALRADQVATDLQLDAYQQAQAHMALADRYAGQLGPMILVLVRGLSGSGKTTLASEVARRFGAELLSSDAVRHELFGPSSPNSAFGTGIYRAENRRRVYEEMLTRTEHYLGEGISVILDGTYLAGADRQEAVSVGRRWGVPSLIVNCQCDPDDARQRIADRQARGGGLSAARPEFYDLQYELEESTSPDLPSINVDTSLPLAAQAEQVIQRLRFQCPC